MSSRYCLVVLFAVLLVSGRVIEASPPATKDKPRVDASGDLLPEGVLARLGTVRLKHDGETIVSFSPDGKQLISLGADSALCTWSLPDGRKLRSFSRPDVKFASIRGFANADEHMALRLMLKGGGVGLAALQMRQQLCLSATDSGVGAVAHSRDGRWLACVKPKKGLFIWDTTGGMEPRHFGEMQCLMLAFSPDARLLAAAETESAETLVLGVWDLQTGRRLWKLKTQAGSVHQALRFSPDGKYLAAREVNFIRLWNMTSGKRTRLYATQYPIVDWAFAPDSKHLAAVLSNSQGIVVWETASEEEVGTMTIEGTQIATACFAGDGSSLFTWSADGVFRQWNWREGRELRGWESQLGGVVSLALGPDGKTLAAATGEGTITLWDVKSAAQIGPARNPEIKALAFTEQDKLFLYSAEGDAQWVDWLPAKARHKRARPTAKGTPFAVNGSARVQAWKEDEHVDVVEADTGKTLARMEGGEQLANLVLSPDGRAAAAAYSDESVRLWNLATARETRRLDVATAVQMAFSHDGKTLAILGSDHEIRMWEVATGEQRCRFQATQSGVGVLEFTPDDRFLAAACADESVRIWDALTGKRVRSLVGHFGAIEALAVSPDSRRLASGGADGVIHIWDLGAGRRERRLEGHRGPITALAFAPDGKRLASAGKDTTVLVWDLTAPPRQAPAPPRGRLDHCWEDLGRAEGRMSFRAMTELIGAPGHAIVLFRTHLAPVPSIKGAVIEGLIAELRHDKYAVREQATKELAKLEERARPFMIKALAGKTDGELAKRLQYLIDLLDAPPAEPDHLRGLRAVEVLERIGTPAALQLLDEWAQGDAHARLTQLGRQAGRRVRQRLNVNNQQ
jgi:WD40 repeat protein